MMHRLQEQVNNNFHINTHKNGMCIQCYTHTFWYSHRVLSSLVPRLLPCALTKINGKSKAAKINGKVKVNFSRIFLRVHVGGVWERG